MTTTNSTLNIMVEGCCHGALDEIYAGVRETERRRGVAVDLLLICGDFQGLRTPQDFHALAVPAKYRQMNSFSKYYRGEAVAHCLTVVIGGNHEASNAMGALHYGGWLAPKIYYLGAAGCVRFRGLKIAGLSGIYNKNHYYWHRFETRAETGGGDSIRSIYHVREIDVFRLSQLSRPDIFLSHDWPRGIEQHGDAKALAKKKPFFKKEIERNDLGSPANELLLHFLKPKRWFSAHLHCKFVARVSHPDQTATDFLALDKCLPRRDFLSLLTIPAPSWNGADLEYDPEWLAILQHTHHLSGDLPPPATVQIPTQSPRVDPAAIARFTDLAIPPPPPLIPGKRILPRNPLSEASPQTDAFLAKLNLPHTVTLPCPSPSSPELPLPVRDPNQIDLDDDDDDDARQSPREPPPAKRRCDDPNQIDLDDV